MTRPEERLQAPPAWLQLEEDGTGLEVEEFPSVLMLAAGTLFQRNIFKPLLDPYGIGVAEWRVLISLNRYGPATSADIVGRSWMDKAQVSRAAIVLEEAGLVGRAVDPAHAKRIILRSTSQGKKLYAQLYSAARKEQAKLLSLLSAEERQAMFSGLQKIIRYVGDYPN